MFTPRLIRPEAGNKYYIRKSSGGYSSAIKGKPTDKDCDVLPNCVGYAYGRFNEIGGYSSCKYLKPVNAEKFIKYKGDLEVGFTPKLGACMVWQKGKTLDGSDGAGHVAIVEKIVSEDEIVTSESGYNSKVFWTQTRKKGTNGNWGQASSFTFLGFIYNPAVSDDEQIVEKTPENAPVPAPSYQGKIVSVSLPQLVKGNKGEAVRTLQTILNARGYTDNSGKTLVVDGSFGPATSEAVKKAQKAAGVAVDGYVGKDTWTSILLNNEK